DRVDVPYLRNVVCDMTNLHTRAARLGEHVVEEAADILRNLLLLRAEKGYRLIATTQRGNDTLVGGRLARFANDIVAVDPAPGGGVVSAGQAAQGGYDGDRTTVFVAAYHQGLG